MRFLAFTLPDLHQIHDDVTLSGVVLGAGINSPGALEAVLPAATGYRQIRIEGTDRTVELIREWGTLLIGVSGNVVHSYIVWHADPDAEDQDLLRIQGFGIGSIPDEMPWTASDRNYIKADPLRIFRDIWGHLVSFPDTIGVTVDATTSPIRVGEPEREENFTTQAGEDVAFTTGPHKINWHSSDLGREIRDLATETPFEWREVTSLDMRSEARPTFHIELGYPVIEPKERDLYFEVGVNVIEPDEESDDDFATDVLVRGAGEGEKKRRGEARRSDTHRMRRVKVVEDQSLTSKRQADQRAEEVLGISKYDKFWTSITVLPHPGARPGSYEVGDLITVRGLTVWGGHSQRCRIVELSHTLETDTISLTLEKWD